MNTNPSLVLVQSRKTRPFLTERLLMGRKESNQTNKNLANLGEPNEVHKHNQSILHKQQCLRLPSQNFGWKIKNI